MDAMKWFFFIICVVIISGCSNHDNFRDSIVQIQWIHNGIEVVRGMGVCVDNSIILTSAHVVRDDRFLYEVMGTRYQVIERDIVRDTAYMKQLYPEHWNTNKSCTSQIKYIWKQKSQVNDSVYVPLMRSGSIVLAEGRVVSLTWNILWYDNLGHVQFMTEMLVTDILFEPGDSGAPMLDAEGQVVDVVHVR